MHFREGKRDMRSFKPRAKSSNPPYCPQSASTLKRQLGKHVTSKRHTRGFTIDRKKKDGRLDLHTKNSTSRHCFFSAYQKKPKVSKFRKFVLTIFGLACFARSLIRFFSLSFILLAVVLLDTTKEATLEWTRYPYGPQAQTPGVSSFMHGGFLSWTVDRIRL